MKRFLLFVENSKIVLYEKSEKGFKIQNINGNPFFNYSNISINEDIKELLEYLIDVFGLESSEEISFGILSGESKNIKDLVCNAISRNGASVESIDITGLLKLLLKNLINEGIPLVDKYGINYKGSRYDFVNNVFTKLRFNLLSYTVTEEDLSKTLESIK